MQEWRFCGEGSGEAWILSNTELCWFCANYGHKFWFSKSGSRSDYVYLKKKERRTPRDIWMWSFEELHSNQDIMGPSGKLWRLPVALILPFQPPFVTPGSSRMQSFTCCGNNAIAMVTRSCLGYVREDMLLSTIVQDTFISEAVIFKL